VKNIDSKTPAKDQNPFSCAHEVGSSPRDEAGDHERYLAAHERVAEDLTRLIDSANAPIIGINAEGEVNEWNRTAERITGFSKPEAVGRDLIATFISDEHKVSVRDVLDKALRGQETSSYELSLLTKNGNVRHVLLNATTRRDAHGNVIGVVGVGQDITERAQAKLEQLRQHAKLEALESLTGSIAHDFNNLLTVIVGNISMIESDDPFNQVLVQDALKATSDGAQLSQSLLSFSRKRSPNHNNHNLNVVLREFQRSIARMLGEAIEVRISVHAPTTIVRVDRSLLETALLNLCLNARDAIDSSGRIDISVTPGPATPSDFETFGLHFIRPSQRYVRLSVTDNGHGVATELIPKLTEPFFTTKADGAGLGLSSVAGFVKQSGGGMHILSTLGVGTSVQFLLPLGKPGRPGVPSATPQLP
jgi:PAS domain S-box-containing protein